jgi:hypothetical protein
MDDRYLPHSRIQRILKKGGVLVHRGNGVLTQKEVYWPIEIVEFSVKKRKKVTPEVVQYGSPDDKN